MEELGTSGENEESRDGGYNDGQTIGGTYCCVVLCVGRHEGYSLVDYHDAG